MARLLDAIFAPIILTIRFLREKLRERRERKRIKKELETAVVNCIDRATNRVSLTDWEGGTFTVEGAGIADDIHEDMIIIGDELFGEEESFQRAANTPKRRVPVADAKPDKRYKMPEIELKTSYETSVSVANMDTLKWIMRYYSVKTALVREVDRRFNRVLLVDVQSGRELIVIGESVSTDIENSQLIDAESISKRTSKIPEMKSETPYEAKVSEVDMDALKWIMRSRSFKTALVREVNRRFNRVLLVDVVTGQEIIVIGKRVSRKIKDSQIIEI